ERDLISQKFSGRDNDPEDDHMNTLPFENTNEIPADPEILGSPPELIPIRRSGVVRRKCIFVGYPKETMGYYFYFPPENKVIVARYANFLERDLISQKFSGRDNDPEDDHMNTLPFENTNEIPADPEILGSPPELIPIRRSERTTRAPNRLCLNIEVKDNELGDLGEPANYKAAMLDHDKVIWQGLMDEEMNFMKVMKVWIVVDLPPN
nr:retrovirus-related Pol polyprotein from transposon TNT 1-94 [Tanacetum cinerariifolium]